MGCWKFGLSLVFLSLTAAAQDDVPEFTVPHAECSLFGANMNRIVGKPRSVEEAALTNLVASRLPHVPPGMRPLDFDKRVEVSTIDHYIFGALKEANVTAAPTT